MKLIIIKELFKLILKELRIKFKIYIIILYKKIITHLTIILSSIAIIISIISLKIVLNNNSRIDKEINESKKSYEPMKEKLGKFDKLYFQENEMK